MRDLVINMLHSPLGALSTLKLWRNWLGLRLMLVSGLEAPDLRAISTSSTVIGCVWNLALFCFLRPRLETAGRQGEAEEGGGRLVRGVEGEGEEQEEEAVAVASNILTLSMTEEMLSSAAWLTSWWVTGWVRWRG